jgi:hypothetical protein
MKLAVQGAILVALAVGCGAKSGGGDGGSAPVNGNSTSETGNPNKQTPAGNAGPNGFMIDGSATTTSWTLTGGTLGPNKAVTKLSMNDVDFRLDITTGKRLDSVFFSNSSVEGSCAKDPTSKLDQKLITGACSTVNLQGTQVTADITGFTYSKTGTSTVAGYSCDVFRLNLTTNVTYEGRTYAGRMSGDVCIAKSIPTKIGLVDFTKSVNGLDITVKSAAIRQKIEASAVDLSGMIMRSKTSAEAFGTSFIGAKVATNETTYAVTKVTAQTVDTATFAFPMAGYSMAN